MEVSAGTSHALQQRRQQGVRRAGSGSTPHRGVLRCVEGARSDCRSLALESQLWCRGESSKSTEGHLVNPVSEEAPNVEMQLTKPAHSDGASQLISVLAGLSITDAV